jgi:hypothetical protein
MTNINTDHEEPSTKTGLFQYQLQNLYTRVPQEFQTQSLTVQDIQLRQKCPGTEQGGWGWRTLPTALTLLEQNFITGCCKKGHKLTILYLLPSSMPRIT